MSDDIAIKVENLSKCYHIYDQPRDRLKQMILPRLQRAVGAASKQYFREFWALKNVSFEVKKGETVGIIGRNGSGKSTLLQMICGTLNPTSGSIQTNGRIAALLELGSGFNPEFTGRENVYLNGAVLGLSKAEIDHRFDEIAAFADIGEFIEQPVKTYSSGMVVRVAFATAVHLEPDLLVVDEALSVGDIAFQQKCLDRIRRIQASGVSILLVTHSNNALLEYCDRCIYLKNGGLVLNAKPEVAIGVYSKDLVEIEGGSAISLNSIEKKFLSDKNTADSISIKGADNAEKSVIGFESVKFYDDSGMEAAVFNSGDVMSIELGLYVSEYIENPCFGIQLRSTDGIELWSATTQLLNFYIKPMCPGKHKVEWKLRVNFSTNKYVVALGVGLVINGEYKRVSRLDFAGYFDVLQSEPAGFGWLAPAPVFNIK